MKGKVETMVPLYITDLDIDLLKINATVIDRLSNENVTQEVELKVVDAEFYVESDTPTFKAYAINKLNVVQLIFFSYFCQKSSFYFFLSWLQNTKMAVRIHLRTL
jgi:hypothetical protein